MKQESQHMYNTKSFMIKLKRNKLKHELKKYNLIILIGLEEKKKVEKEDPFCAKLNSFIFFLPSKNHNHLKGDFMIAKLLKFSFLFGVETTYSLDKIIEETYPTKEGHQQYIIIKRS